MKSKIRDSAGDRVFSVIVYVLITLIMLVILYPLIYIVSCSISNPDFVFSGKVWLLPKGLTIEGYKRVLQDPDILTGYQNTIFYTVAGTAVNIAVTLAAAYSLSKRFLPGRNVLMLLITFTMYFSGGMIPSYLLMKDLSLLNTRIGLILIGCVSTYNLIIARTFFMNGVPQELEDAAQIDGCSYLKSFLLIVLPLSRAMTSVLVLYYGISHWNAYFSAMIYLTDNALRPLQLILREILIENETKATMLAEDEEIAYLQQQTANLIKYAVIVVSSAPVLVLYPFLQKYFNKGVMLGSLKG